MTGNNHVEGVLDVTVIDTSGDGEGSFIDGDSFFRAASFSGIPAVIPFPGSTSFTVPDMVSPGTITQVNSSATINPANAGGTLFDELGIDILGKLSPGDTVIFDAFTCIVPEGEMCAPRPDFTAAVPIPAAFWLFFSALASMCFIGSKIAR